LADRSVTVSLERRLPSEPVSRFLADRIDDLKSLARKAARSAEDHAARLGRSDPEIPEAIFNRDADNWRPLFTVAEIAGGNWPERVKKAALAQTGAVDSDETQILADVGDLFAEKSLTKDDDGMPCHTLVDALVAMPDRSWSECNRGKALTDPTKGEEDARVQERGMRVEQELLLRAGQPECFVNQCPLRLRNS
jgi:Protein of unknown function (DUF3631)